MKNLYLLLLVCLCISCKKNEKEIEETCSTGVVLIQNQSYYEITLSNGGVFYFSNLNDNEELVNFTAEKDSIKVITSYGTGFFISPEGEIATNYHVVSNTISDKEVNKSVNKILNNLKKILSNLYTVYQNKLQQVQAAYNYANMSPEVSYAEFYKIRDIRNELIQEMKKCMQYYNSIDGINDIEVTYHNEVSIAYNNTFVTNTKDFLPCVVTKSDPEHDLAIIQLKNKKTPEDKYIFKIEEDPLENYTLVEKYIKPDKNGRLYTLSFNLGPTLALTQEGIKSQFNSGNISQKTSDRLMYSIPTLPGSSGSPVINEEGQLVAINFAGLNGTQSFNYGIRVKHLQKLINN